MASNSIRYRVGAAAAALGVVGASALAIGPASALPTSAIIGTVRQTGPGAITYYVGSAGNVRSCSALASARELDSTRVENIPLVAGAGQVTLQLPAATQLATIRCITHANTAFVPDAEVFRLGGRLRPQLPRARAHIVDIGAALEFAMTDADPGTRCFAQYERIGAYYRAGENLSTNFGRSELTLIDGAGAFRTPSLARGRYAAELTCTGAGSATRSPAVGVFGISPGLDLGSAGSDNAWPSGSF